MKTILTIVKLFCLFSLIGTFISQAEAQTPSVEFVPVRLVFDDVEVFPIAGGSPVLQRTIIIKNIGNLAFSNITLKSTPWYELNSSATISPESIHFDQNGFGIPAGGFHEALVTVEVTNLKPGTYRGYILISVDSNETLQLEATLLLRRSAFYPIIIGSTVLLLVLIAFWLLLQKNGHARTRFGPATRLGAAFGIIVFALLLVTIASPFGIGINSIIVTAILTPFIAYLISVLKADRDFSKEIDKASHEYRKKMIETESGIIGSLIGELTVHVAAFTARDWPRPCKLPIAVWEKSEKTGLISDIHTRWLAEYYHYVPLYNICIGSIEKLCKTKTETDTSQADEYKKSFLEVKKSFAYAETLLYHMLSYDLGSLQQRYLARETVEFPYHMCVLLKDTLERFGIIHKGEEIDKSVYSNENTKKFNLKMGKIFNGSYAQLQKNLNSLLSDLERGTKHRKL